MVTGSGNESKGHGPWRLNAPIFVQFLVCMCGMACKDMPVLLYIDKDTMYCMPYIYMQGRQDNRHVSRT